MIAGTEERLTPPNLVHPFLLGFSTAITDISVPFVSTAMSYALSRNEMPLERDGSSTLALTRTLALRKTTSGIVHTLGNVCSCKASCSFFVFKIITFFR